MAKKMESVQTKSIFDYVIYAVLLIGIVADIVFLILDFGDQTFTLGCFICVLCGSAVGLIDLFLKEKELPLLLSCFCYILACGFHLVVALPSLSDLWNNVNFIGGNQQAAIIFGAIFLGITIFMIVINFFQRKNKNR